MIKKSFLILALMMSVPLYCSAVIFGERNPVLLDNMYSNPEEYICVGGENFGLSFYLDKNSINVHQYNPPHYIIAFKGVNYKSSDPWTEEFASYNSRITRYKYNYSTREMFLEVFDENQVPHWQYVRTNPLTATELRQMTGGDRRWYERKITQGEIAFYLAYGMSFFDQPITETSEDFIIKGMSSIVSTMSPFRDTPIPALKGYRIYNQYLYNHREKRHEVWQVKYNERTRERNTKQIR